MSARRNNALNVHASAVVIAEHGVIIRGVSGAGKSRLVQALLQAAERQGLFARLIGDDRVMIAVTNGRALVCSHPAIAGMLEERGAGILTMPYEVSARADCIIDLMEGPVAAVRVPAIASTSDESLGVKLPRLAISTEAGPDEGARRVMAFLRRIYPC